MYSLPFDFSFSQDDFISNNSLTTWTSFTSIRRSAFCIRCVGWGKQVAEKNKAYQNLSGSAESKGEIEALLYPSTDLADNTPLEHVRFSTRIRNGLAFGGLKTVGEVRMASDAALLSFQDLGPGSVRHLRETLGLKAKN